ncbi:MAG: hypothetical protein GY915_02260 [bacterium]|nr:hypothetical protein [bacterium]
MGLLWTIPLGRSFIRDLAIGLHNHSLQHSIPLGDYTIFLPTRRACQMFQESLLKTAPKESVLLPRLIPLGKMALEDLLPLGLKPQGEWLEKEVLSFHQTLGILFGLIQKARPKLQASHILRLAKDLSALLEEFTLEGLPFENLKTAVPEDVAEHRQQAYEFLEVVTTHWPEILKEKKAALLGQAQRCWVEGMLSAWKETPHTSPVFIAGSTGSRGLIRHLMKGVLNLPHGGVILPGFDQSMGQKEWGSLPPAHPSYTISMLLKELEKDRDQIPLWSFQGETPSHRVHSLWSLFHPTEIHFVEEESSFSNTALVASKTLEEEACSIALILRSVLKEKEKTACLVTTDRDLVRRVKAALQRWNVTLNDPAGTPFHTTAVGTLVALVSQFMAQELPGSVLLLSLLKHPLVTLSSPRGEVLDAAREFEKISRQRPVDRHAGGLAPGDHLKELLDKLEAFRQNQINSLQELSPFGEILKACRSFLEFLSPDIWRGEIGRQGQELFEEIAHASSLWPNVTRVHFSDILEGILQGAPLRRAWGTQDRLRVLNPIQARFVTADVMILGGLNEGSWPAEVPDDPWMARAQRKALGLRPVEQDCGLAAHDFCSYAVCAPRVYLTRAGRDAKGSPTTQSRFLMRLQSSLSDQFQSLLERGNLWKNWATMLLEEGARSDTKPQRPENPCPPIIDRPKRFSVTQIARWVQDPFAFYCDRLLRLEDQNPLEAPPGPLDKGILWHKILEDFCRQRSSNGDIQQQEQFLLSVAQDVLKDFEGYPEVRHRWIPAFQEVAPDFLKYLSRYEEQVQSSFFEVSGEWICSELDRPFTLAARADRIDVLKNGQLRIVDYKTGTLPFLSALKSGQAVQLPLEAFMAQKGVFKGIAAGSVESIQLWRINGEAGGFKTVVLEGEDLEKAIALSKEKLHSLVQSYGNLDQGYALQVPGLEHIRGLSRLQEWAA